MVQNHIITYSSPREYWKHIAAETDSLFRIDQPANEYNETRSSVSSGSPNARYNFITPRSRLLILQYHRQWTNSNLMPSGGHKSEVAHRRRYRTASGRYNRY